MKNSWCQHVCAVILPVGSVFIEDGEMETGVIITDRQETVKFHLEPTGSQTNLQSLVACWYLIFSHIWTLLKLRWSETSLILDSLIYYEITFFPSALRWKIYKHQIIDSEKVIGASIISCCWCSWIVDYLFRLQTGCAAGVHLQVFGNQSGGDWVHRSFVSQKHWKGFISELFKVKHLSEEKNAEKYLQQAIAITPKWLQNNTSLNDEDLEMTTETKQEALKSLSLILSAWTRQQSNKEHEVHAQITIILLIINDSLVTPIISAVCTL